MKRRIQISKQSTLDEASLLELLQLFKTKGELIGNGKRNVIKILTYQGETYNIKAFKRPNYINKIAYRYIRKSKAERSFLYAHMLLVHGVKTPEPVAFVEFMDGPLLGDSYYISKQLDYDFTIRKLIDEPKFQDYEEVLRAFTRFTFGLHEKGIHFLDHSPGNTLIIKSNQGYEFYLVDLNRMKFEQMDFEKRMQNFARLSPKDYMLDIISDEYSKLYPEADAELIRERMYHHSIQFSTSFKRWEKFKKDYFFWRKR